MSNQPSLQGSHKGGEHEHQHVQSVGMRRQGLLAACLVNHRHCLAAALPFLLALWRCVMNSDREIMSATKVAVPPSTSHTLLWKADANAQVPEQEGRPAAVSCPTMPCHTL